MYEVALVRGGGGLPAVYVLFIFRNALACSLLTLFSDFLSGQVLRLTNQMYCRIQWNMGLLKTLGGLA